MATIGTKGGELDLLIRQGATNGWYYTTILTSLGAPIDLTGGVFRAQIRKTPDAPTLDGVTFEFEITDGVNGEMRWRIPATSTENIPADEAGENAAGSTYVWDFEFEDSAGRVYPIFYGAVNVFREVTKDD